MESPAALPPRVAAAPRLPAACAAPPCAAAAFAAGTAPPSIVMVCAGDVCVEDDAAAAGLLGVAGCGCAGGAATSSLQMRAGLPPAAGAALPRPLLACAASSLESLRPRPEGVPPAAGGASCRQFTSDLGVCLPAAASAGVAAPLLRPPRAEPGPAAAAAAAVALGFTERGTAEPGRPPLPAGFSASPRGRCMMAMRSPACGACAEAVCASSAPAACANAPLPPLRRYSSRSSAGGACTWCGFSARQLLSSFEESREGSNK